MATRAPFGGRSAGFTAACCAEAEENIANTTNSKPDTKRFLEIFFIIRMSEILRNLIVRLRYSATDRKAAMYRFILNGN